MSKEQKQPIQPKYIDAGGTLRFKKNAIVDYLASGKLNNLVLVDIQFSAEDWAQFYQLIGYSISGFGDLNEVTDEEFYRATNDEPAQLEKAPEPEWVHLEFTGRETIATSLYTSPPYVAELVKQNVELLHRVVDLKSLYESASKTNEQSHVALAESQHKVTDLEKQVQALQAEIDRFRNPPSVATVAIELEIDKQLIASAMDPGRMHRQDGIYVYEAFLEAMDKDKSCSKQ